MHSNEIDIENFEPVEIFPGLINQIDIQVAHLANNPQYVRILQFLLTKNPAIHSVQASVEDKTVKINYEHSKLPLENLIKQLNQILSNIPEPINNTATNSKCPSQHVTRLFMINGMKCPACAIFIEMTLNQNSEVRATVDYDSAQLKIDSSLASDSLITLIESTGFEVSQYQ